MFVHSLEFRKLHPSGLNIIAMVHEPEIGPFIETTDKYIAVGNLNGKYIDLLINNKDNQQFL
jgi:hypothetical protein